MGLPIAVLVCGQHLPFGQLYERHGTDLFREGAVHGAVQGSILYRLERENGEEHRHCYQQDGRPKHTSLKRPRPGLRARMAAG